MTLQEMCRIKQEYGFSNQELSRRSGLPVSTLQRLFSGQAKSPRMQTLLTLEMALIDYVAEHSDPPHAASFREKSVPYDVQAIGKYTLDDYYALPDERRVELIDGRFYDMSAPSTTHQKILGQLFLQFNACAEAHGDQCEVFLSPCDVQLDRDEKTMVQPDLIVICGDNYRVKYRCIYGAPDLLVEILSPSTRSKDMLLKLNKYLKAGVQEYWIIDPEREEVLVYYFAVSNSKPKKYTFDDQIPVHISQGKCTIDFARIHQKLFPKN